MEISIVIKVNEIELKLTSEEARNLFDTLKGMFGDKVVYTPQPTPYPNWNWWEMPTTTCETTHGNDSDATSATSTDFNSENITLT